MTSDTRDLPEVRVGFIPLVDAAPLIVAVAKGFDRAEGVAIRLSREASWANIRDRLAFGALDAAHMLAPMALASALKIGPATEPVLVPMALNLGGSAITVSRELFAQMQACDAAAATAGGAAAARALAPVIAARRAAGEAPLMLGMVFPFSSHNYDLRLWLASAGIDPDEDVNLVVIPPPLIAESLATGRVDGFCVGSPWSSVAVENSGARIVATKAELWADGPEKVLGVGVRWAERNPETLARLVRALDVAARWLDQPANRTEAAALLAASAAVGVRAALIERVLSGRMVRSAGAEPTSDDDFVLFHRRRASVPRVSHALWLLAQMIRWGQAREPFSLSEIATRVYRPDLYRAALGAAAAEAGDGDLGRAPDGFDPSRPLAALAAARIRSQAIDLDGLAALNS